MSHNGIAPASRLAAYLYQCEYADTHETLASVAERDDLNLDYIATLLRQPGALLFRDAYTNITYPQYTLEDGSTLETIKAASYDYECEHWIETSGAEDVETARIYRWAMVTRGTNILKAMRWNESRIQNNPRIHAQFLAKIEAIGSVYNYIGEPTDPTIARRIRVIRTIGTMLATLDSRKSFSLALGSNCRH